jgi:hypothetical protein
MYRCRNCGNSFDTPKEIRERHGFTWGGYETFYMCPYCRGDDFTEVDELYYWDDSCEDYDPENESLETIAELKYQLQQERDRVLALSEMIKGLAEGKR